MTTEDFIPPPYTEIAENASVSYQSPSNIALVNTGESTESNFLKTLL